MSEDESGDSEQSVEEAVEDSGFVATNTGAQKGKFSDDNGDSESSDE